jgi:hypothetical protein
VEIARFQPRAIDRNSQFASLQSSRVYTRRRPFFPTKLTEVRARKCYRKSSTALRTSCSRPGPSLSCSSGGGQPKSFGISFISCEADVRTGGTYRFVFSHAASEQPMAFFGRYIEVTPHSRIVWTNEESADGAVSTVTFEEKGDKKLLVLHELYPSKQALDDAIASGSTSGAGEQFEQLDTPLATLVRS